MFTFSRNVVLAIIIIFILLFAVASFGLITISVEANQNRNLALEAEVSELAIGKSIELGICIISSVHTLADGKTLLFCNVLNDITLELPKGKMILKIEKPVTPVPPR